MAIGCVVDGCPPQIPLTEADIQHDLDRRRPGQSRFTTQRREPDQVKILSGVMAHPETGMQVTTGAPIALLIENTDQRSKDYSDIKDKFRPGHADFTYEAKYGLRDYRGGGRSSARETAARVAAGAIARKVVPGITVRGALVQMGPHQIPRQLDGTRSAAIRFPRTRRRRVLEDSSTTSARRALDRAVIRGGRRRAADSGADLRQARSDLATR